MIRNRDIVIAFVFSILSCGIYYLFSTLTGITIPCLILKVTGLYCPGCGVTRMSVSLIQLDFYQAFRYNAGVMLVLPILIIGCIQVCYRYIKNGVLELSKPFKIVLFIVIVWLLIYGILRNSSAFVYFVPTIV